MFNLKTPCKDCPFLRVGGIRLRPARVREIAAAFTDSQGATFPCHRTVETSGDEDENGDEIVVNIASQEFCAGGLIFAEKQGCANQMMRIGERIGSYDRRKLTGHDRVFDSVDEMLRLALR